MKIYKPALFWFIVAFLLRFVLGLSIHFYSVTIGRGGFFPLPSGADDEFYWSSALSLLAGQHLMDLPNPYPYFLAGLFSFTGPSLLIGKLANIVFGALSVYFGVLLAKKLTPQGYTRSWRSPLHPANLTGFFLSFYPAAAFYSTQLLKDPITIFLGILCFYYFINALQHKRLMHWLIGGLALLGVYQFRPYAAIAIGLALGAYLLFQWRAKTSSKLAGIGLFLLIIALAPYYAGYGIFGIRYIGSFTSLETIATIRKEVYSHGGSMVGIAFHDQSVWNLILFYLYSFLTVTFGPLPWQVKSLNILVALPEAMVMWLFIPLWLISLKRIFSGRPGEEKLLIYFSWILLGIIALFSDNIGASVRLRILSWSIFLVFAALYIGGRSCAGYNPGKS